MRPLEDSIVRLLKSRPFYGHLLLQFRRRQTTSGKAAGATIRDGVPTLYINPQHFSLFSPAEQDALLEHLIKHILHLHPSRRGDRNPRFWDLACDVAINQTIDHLPPEAAQPQSFRLPENLAAEEYYPRLQQVPLLGTSTGQGDGSGQRGDTLQNGTQIDPIDDHQIWQEASRTPPALSEQVVRTMVQSALRKSHDEVSDDIRTLIDPLLQLPTIPWQQILRQFVGTAGRTGRTATWQRAHRRFGHTTPGHKKRQLLNLLVAIDTSESTDSEDLREAFARELLQIARSRQSRITVLYAGSTIRRIDTFSRAPQHCDVVRGGGFTDLRPAFDYALTMQPRPAAIIYLTDGYGPAPETMEIPTLWALTPDGQKPVDWGVELRLTG
ncbi:MAG: hypothetical protein C0618_07950 [Desulfuromonas sp.]|nr:MAG: hypothetical protein C0618_07950 [Desulfuromonas sp.]